MSRACASSSSARERCVPAEERVHVEVVVGVVPMVGRRCEDGVQVQRRRRPGRWRRSRCVHDAVEVAALEAVAGRRALPGLERTRGRDPTAARQPVGEDLVEDGVPDPGWRVDGHMMERIVGRSRRCCSSSARCHPVCSSSLATPSSCWRSWASRFRSSSTRPWSPRSRSSASSGCSCWPTSSSR